MPTETITIDLSKSPFLNRKPCQDSTTTSKIDTPKESSAMHTDDEMDSEQVLKKKHHETTSEPQVLKTQ
jgi:hypothetical protein